MHQRIKNILLLISCLFCINYSFAQNIENIENKINFDNIIQNEEKALLNLNAEFSINKQKCYSKFFANWCIKKLEQDFYKNNDKIENKLLEYKKSKRKSMFDETQSKIAQAHKTDTIEEKDRLEQEKQNRQYFEYKQQQDKNRQ